MSIFSTFRNIFFIIVALFSLVSFSVYKINVLNKAHFQALVQQEELKELGRELAQGSDYLTDEIRRYVQFGDQVHYDNFWNEVNVVRSRENAVQRLKEFEVLPSELAFIEKAKSYSDKLIKTEEKAMLAVEEGSLDEARKLLFGEHYDEQKGLIMRSINKFRDVVNTRTEAQAKHFYKEMSFYIMLTDVLLLICGVLVLFLVYNIGIRRILNPLKRQTHVMRELAMGNLKTPIVELEKKDEIGEMGKALQIFKENAIQKNLTELKLSKANKLRSHILESVEEGIFGLDSDGNSTFFNPKAEELTGYTLEELKKTSSHSLLHHTKADGSPYPAEDCPIHRSCRDAEIYRVTDEVFWRKDGSSFPVEYTTTPIYEAGALTGAVVVFRDVSERKHADEVLKQIVMGTSAAIGDDFLKSLVKNLATSLNVKFAFVGQLSKDRESIITRAVCKKGELVENIEYLIRDTPCEKVVNGGENYFPENVQQLFPKDLFLVEMGVDSYLGVPLFDHHKICIGHLAVMHDRAISESIDPEAIMRVFANRAEAELERHQVEQKLDMHLESLERLVSERTSALEKSNQQLSEFAFIASHDLQEPLRKVNMFGDRLRELNQGLDEKSCDYIDRMQRSTVRMQNYIEDLLMYSKLTSRDSPFENTDCNKIIKGNLSDLEGRIYDAGATINVEKIPDIDADPFQISQLFQNLIGNAIKYRKEDVDPVINISALPMENGNLTIKIEDNGIGFDEKYKERIFQIFQRLHGKNAYSGTGIGLALCKKIMEHHNGSLTVNSSPGVGTTFYASLPVRRAPSSDPLIN